MIRSINHLIRLLGLAAMLSVCAAVPAIAAPSLSVELTRDEADFPVVHHSDERVDFTVMVKNSAAKLESVSPGDQLTCDPNPSKWNSEVTAFAFEWLSSGVEVGSEAAYEVQVADEGHSLQCLVTAENAGGASLAATLPLTVLPSPSPLPPTYAGEGQPQPLVAEVEAAPGSGAGGELICTAPITWSGSLSWTFEWLRDGSPANGEVTATTATTSTYKIAAADVPGTLQCVAIAKTGSGGAPTGGTVVTTSPLWPLSPAPSPYPPFDESVNPPYAAYLPFIVDPSSTSGPVSFELELPAGEETFAFKTQQAGIGWACDRLPASKSHPAKVVCSREDALTPGTEFPPLAVITALGADAPDLATAKVTVFGGGGTPASDELAFPIAPAIPFGLSKFTAALRDEAGIDYTQAGGHPFLADSEVVFNQKRMLTPLDPVRTPFAPIAQARQIIADLPRGIVGNPLSLPALCPGVEEIANGECPPESVVGGVDIFLSDSSAPPKPIYAIEPEFGAPAQFAFREPLGRVYTFTPRLRPDDGYAVSLEVAPAPEGDILNSTVTLCDFGGIRSGSDPLADFLGCRKKGEPGVNPKALFTNPTRCGPLTTRVRLNSWPDPTFVEGPPFVNAPITGCDKVPFEPKANLQPSSHQADSPTGFDVEVSVPTQGLEDPDGISQSHLREARVTLPEGMAVNPAAGAGLGACSADQIKLGTTEPISCPQSSKIGTVEIETPVIDETLKGAVYVAKQGDVEGSLVGFYLVFDSPKNGILVKQPARVTPDPVTGQLVVTVAESPEQPFSAVRMHFPGGSRAILLTPPRCGSYEITSELTPWSGDAPVVQKSSFDIDQGPGGGPCPSGALNPHLTAGASDATAGKASPFFVRLHRDDGSQRLTALDLHMPPGLSAYLKGVPYCPNSVLAAISSSAGSGQGEIDHPSCPAASQIGRVVVSAGAGPDPLYVDSGRAYLAGPYKGAPLSIAVVAPAVAGPLDLGSVVVRNALRLDPETAQVSVVSDPIPTILHGLLLDIRDIRVSIDRDHFTLNPTSCEPKSVGAEVKGTGGASLSLSSPFQVGGCENLTFEPRLSLRLFGATRRGGNPKLRTVLRAGFGEANIARAEVTIPHSEFLDQSHIRTICTGVQFAAKACPPGSVYGYAKAFTPLLDYPVQGPVYLRSSKHALPDLVVDLYGPDYQPVEALVVGRIDSIKGQIRATIESAPDLPVSKFILTQRGGKKGLLINSRDICASNNRATIKLTAQNGMTHDFRPLVENGKCGKRAHKEHKRRHR